MKIITANRENEIGKRLARIMGAVIWAVDNMPLEKWIELSNTVTEDIADIAALIGGEEMMERVGEWRKIQWIDRNALLEALPKDTELLREQVIDAIMSVPTSEDREVKTQCR